MRTGFEHRHARKKRLISAFSAVREGQEPIRTCFSRRPRRFSQLYRLSSVWQLRPLLNHQLKIGFSVIGRELPLPHTTLKARWSVQQDSQVECSTPLRSPCQPQRFSNPFCWVLWRKWLWLLHSFWPIINGVSASRHPPPISRMV